MKGFLSKKFAAFALAGAMVFATSCNAEPATETPPDYDRVTQIFADILQISARNAAVNPDMAKAGLEALQYMVDEIEKNHDFKIELQVPPGYTPTLNDVVNVFYNLPRISAQAGVSEEEMARLGIDAIEKMLKSVDPHADYFPPAESRAMDAEMSSQYAGLGIQIEKPDKGPIQIKGIMSEKTPAHKAGLQEGDKITHIDGADVTSLTSEESIKRMKGDAGTSVKLTVERNGQSFDVDVTRELIEVSPVTSRLIGDLGYIRLNLFTSKASEDIAEAIRKLEAESKTGVQGYILDLRYNPGGYLDEAVEVSDHFLDDGKITTVKSARGEQVYRAKPGDLAQGKPMIVLINEGSASASEIVAGALQDHNRALILGTQSYGKGTVQSIYRLGGDHKFKITTAFYYTPSGDSIQENGITPHIEYVPLDDGGSPAKPKRQKDLEGSYSNPGGAQDLTETFATCSPVEGTDTSALPDNVRYANGEPDWQLICAVENLTKTPAHTKVTPVPAPATQ